MTSISRKHSPRKHPPLSIADIRFEMNAAAMEERNKIIEWLRDASQPMTHTAWALAKLIEEEAHLK